MKHFDYCPNWLDPLYLLDGTLRQRETYRILSQHEVFAILQDFTPCLAGTIPLDCDIPESDADILCRVSNHEEFKQFLRKRFSEKEGFALWQSAKTQGLATVCAFSLSIENLKPLRVEIFGQNVKIEEQKAFRHLVVESRLLALAGDDARKKIRELKVLGMKTEPAFAAFFGIEGEPYSALLDLYDESDEALLAIIRQNPKKLSENSHTVSLH